MNEANKGLPGYEAPAAEELDVEDYPAVTAAGATGRDA